MLLNPGLLARRSVRWALFGFWAGAKRPAGSARRARTARPTLCLERLEPRLVLSMFFPADNYWNTPIVEAPVAANSDAFVRYIWGANSHLVTTFGSRLVDGSYDGLPFNVVPGTQPRVEVIIDKYPGESDIVPVPFPDDAEDPRSGVVQGDPRLDNPRDSDRHVSIFDRDNQILYELWQVSRPSENPDGHWHAGSEAVWRTDRNYFRPLGWTSADAAGMPMAPGYVRYEEVENGRIDHALRFAASRIRNSYVFPAEHTDGRSGDPNAPPMGTRFRLRADFDISGFSPTNQVILTALKAYGMYLVDTSEESDTPGDWLLSGKWNDNWKDDDLRVLRNVLMGEGFARNWQVVDLTPQVDSITPTSGPTVGGTAVTIHGHNFSGGSGLLHVNFGDVPAASFQVLSDSEILAQSPAHAAGTVDVTVSQGMPTSSGWWGYGTSDLVAGDRFTYQEEEAPPVSSLTDDFCGPQIDPGRWEVWQRGGGSAYLENCSLVVDPGDGQAGIFSRERYSLLNSSAVVEVPEVVTGPNTSNMFVVTLDRTAQNEVQFWYENGNLYMNYVISGRVTNVATVRYADDPAAYRWWGFLEQNGTLCFVTSPDGCDWTVRASVADPLPLGSIYVRFNANAFGDPPHGGHARYAHLNLPCRAPAGIQGPINGGTTEPAWPGPSPGTTAALDRSVSAVSGLHGNGPAAPAEAVLPSSILEPVALDGEEHRGDAPPRIRRHVRGWPEDEWERPLLDQVFASLPDA